MTAMMMRQGSTTVEIRNCRTACRTKLEAHCFHNAFPRRLAGRMGVMTSRAPTVSHRAAAASAITGNRGRSIAGHVSIEDSWRSSSAS